MTLSSIFPFLFMSYVCVYFDLACITKSHESFLLKSSYLLAAKRMIVACKELESRIKLFKSDGHAKRKREEERERERGEE